MWLANRRPRLCTSPIEEICIGRVVTGTVILLQSKLSIFEPLSFPHGFSDFNIFLSKLRVDLGNLACEIVVVISRHGSE